MVGKLFLRLKDLSLPDRDKIENLINLVTHDNFCIILGLKGKCVYWYIIFKLRAIGGVQHILHVTYCDNCVFCFVLLKFHLV